MKHEQIRKIPRKTSISMNMETDLFQLLPVDSETPYLIN